MNWRAVLDRLRAAVFPDPEAAAIIDAAERADTGMSRRSFLRAGLLATAVAATVDVEQLLWTPGERTILLPERHNGFDPFDEDWLGREALRILKRNLALTGKFNREYDHKFSKLRIGDTVRVRLPMRFDPYDYSAKVATESVPITLDRFLP